MLFADLNVLENFGVVFIFVLIVLAIVAVVHGAETVCTARRERNKKLTDTYNKIDDIHKQLIEAPTADKNPEQP